MIRRLLIMICLVGVLLMIPAWLLGWPREISLDQLDGLSYLRVFVPIPCDKDRAETEVSFGGFTCWVECRDTAICGPPYEPCEYFAYWLTLCYPPWYALLVLTPYPVYRALRALVARYRRDRDKLCRRCGRAPRPDNSNICSACAKRLRTHWPIRELVVLFLGFMSVVVVVGWLTGWPPTLNLRSEGSGKYELFTKTPVPFYHDPSGLFIMNAYDEVCSADLLLGCDDDGYREALRQGEAQDWRCTWYWVMLGFSVWPILLLCSVFLAVAFIPGSLRRRRRKRRGQCLRCGYDLTGNVTGICSECGRPFERG